MAAGPDFNNQSAQGGDICTREILGDGLNIFAQDGNPDSCPDSAQPEPGELIQSLSNLRLPCRDVGVANLIDPKNLISTTPDGVVDFFGLYVTG